MKKLLILTIITGIFSGCAKDYYTPYSLEAKPESGNLEIVIAEPGYTTVLIDDRKIDNFTGKARKVTISELPVGMHKVDVSIGSETSSLFTKQDSIRIYRNQTSTMIVNNPVNKGKRFVHIMIPTVIGAVLGQWIVGKL